MRLSLIIPAYNEAERLPRFLEALSVFTRAHPGLVADVIIVDDGSSDRTHAVAERFRSRLPDARVVRHATNRGKGAAVHTGIKEARGDAIVFMDADGATPPEELLKIPNALARAPIAVGNRWGVGAEVRGQTPFRSLSSTILRVYTALFGLGGVDTMCGFKAFRADVARRLFHPLLEPRWLFDQEVLFRARLLRIPITSVPIHWTSQRGSKLTFVTFVGSAFALPLLLIRVWRNTRLPYNAGRRGDPPR